MYVDVYLECRGRVCQCMLMCKRVALEASGNRHALHVPLHVHLHSLYMDTSHTHSSTGSRTDCSGILVRYTFTFSSSISSNVVSNVK